MKRFPHRIITLLPVFALGLSAMMYFFYGIAQFQCKMDARSHMSEKGTTITISSHDLKTQHGNNEVWLGGKLYDVGSYTIVGDSVSLVILHDEWEEGIVKNIIDNFDNYDSYTSDNVVHIVKHRLHFPDDNKILVSLYIPSGAVATVNIPHPFPYSIYHTSGISAGVIKPPPNRA